MKINTTGDLLTSIARGLALVSLARWSIFGKKKTSAYRFGKFRRILGVFRGCLGEGEGIAECSVFWTLVHSRRK